MVGEVKGVDSRAGGVGGRTIATICIQFHGNIGIHGGRNIGNDDWDVYYERGRKPKESITKYEAARSL